MLLFVCSEAVESKLVKLETSHTVILPPMVSVLCHNLKGHFENGQPSEALHKSCY